MELSSLFTMSMMDMGLTLLEKWGPSRKTYESEINTLKSYARKRPGHLLYYFSQSLSRSDMEYYFGDLLETVTMLDADGKVYNYNK